MTLTSDHNPRTVSRRSFGLRAAAVALAAVGAVGIPASALAARPLPTPTAITVSDVGQRYISLNIGGPSIKTYDVFANGSRFATAAPSSASVPLTITGVQPGTSYSITVRENSNGRVSALSAPITVRTLAPIAVAPVTNLRAVSVSTTAISIAWTASTTPNVFYSITLNGFSNQSTSLTTATVAESLNCYPGPCAGTGVKPGQINVITVQAETIDAGSSGTPSPVVELRVFVPNA